MNAISLFTNCGAGDIGFKEAGFNFKILAEINKTRLDVAKLNHPRAIGIEGDLEETWQKVVAVYQERFIGQELKLLTACPPCQGFSSARGLRGISKDAESGMFDKRNTLMAIIPKVAIKLRPSIIVIENVPAFLSRKLISPKNGESISGGAFLNQQLRDLYDIYPMLTDLADFGIPQTRKRSVIVLVSKKNDFINTYLIKNGKAPFPIPSHNPDKNGHISVGQIFKDKQIPKISCKSTEESFNLDFHELHEVNVLKEEYYNLIKAIPKHTGKSAWLNNTCTNCNYVNKTKDIKCIICSNILNKPVIKTIDGYRLISGFKTSYKRMSTNKPAHTILTASGSISSHNTIHPYENRVLSAYECQLLQTFPENFKWGNTKAIHGISQIRKMIGEAVPPKFTRLHGKVLFDLLKGKSRKRLIEISDVRVRKAFKAIS